MLYPLRTARNPLHFDKALATMLTTMVMMLTAGLRDSSETITAKPKGRTIGTGEITITITDDGPNAYQSGVTAIQPSSSASWSPQPAVHQQLTSRSIPPGRLDLDLVPSSTVAPSGVRAEIKTALDKLAALPSPPAVSDGAGSLAGEKDFLEALNDAAAGASHVVYLVDRSGSMGAEGRVNKALLVMSEAIEALPRGVPLQVVLFDDQLEVFDFESGAFHPLNGSLTLVAGRGTALRSAAGHVAARGGTEPAPAVAAADEALRGVEHGVLVIVSDGEYLDGEIARVKAANRSGSRIACIVVGSNATGAQTLHAIANQNGGSFSAR